MKKTYNSPEITIVTMPGHLLSDTIGVSRSAADKDGECLSKEREEHPIWD